MLGLSWLAFSDQLPGLRGRSRQHPGPLFRDRDRVLEVRGHRAIFGHGRPLIVENLYVRGPGVYHGFHCDDKALLESLAAAGEAEVRDLWVLVHLPSGAVADELPDHRVPA